MTEKTEKRINEQENKWDKLRKSLPFLNDTEFEQWKSIQEESEKGTLTSEQMQEKLDALNNTNLTRRQKEEKTKAEKVAKDSEEQKKLDQEKDQTKKKQQKEAEKKKNELNNEFTPTSPLKNGKALDNAPGNIVVKNANPKPQKTKQEKTDVQPEEQKEDKNEEQKEEKKEEKKEKSVGKTGSLGIFGGLATIPGAIADRTKGRASSDNYAKNFFWFAAFPTTIATRTAQMGLNFLGDTFRGIFTPKSRKLPRNINRKQKYAKTSETRKTLRHTNNKTANGGKK